MNTRLLLPLFFIFAAASLFATAPTTGTFSNTYPMERTNDEGVITIETEAFKGEPFYIKVYKPEDETMAEEFPYEITITTPSGLNPAFFKSLTITTNDRYQLLRFETKEETTNFASIYFTILTREGTHSYRYSVKMKDPGPFGKTFHFFRVIEKRLNVPGLVALGLLIGFLSGFLGIGGGLIITPLLNIIGAPMFSAVGTGLAYVTGTSIVGTVSNRRHGNLNPKVAIITGLLMIPGIYLGKFFNEVLKGQFGESVFATVIRVLYMLLLSYLIVTLLPRKKKEDANEKKEGGFIHLPPFITVTEGNEKSIWTFSIFSLLIGFASGSLGVGGGFILVPYFLNILLLPTSVAVGSSLLVILVATVIATTNYSLAGAVDFQAVGLLLGGSLVGIYIGTHALKRLHDNIVKYSLITLIGTVIVSLLLKQLGQSFISFVVLIVVCLGIIVNMLIHLVRSHKEERKDESAETNTGEDSATLAEESTFPSPVSITYEDDDAESDVAADAGEDTADAEDAVTGTIVKQAAQQAAKKTAKKKTTKKTTKKPAKKATKKTTKATTKKATKKTTKKTSKKATKATTKKAAKKTAKATTKKATKKPTKKAAKKTTKKATKKTTKKASKKATKKNT